MALNRKSKSVKAGASALMALSLIAGGAAIPNISQAFAVDMSEGELRITTDGYDDKVKNSELTYDIYKVFKGNVVKSGTSRRTAGDVVDVTSIEWADANAQGDSPNIQSAFDSAITEYNRNKEEAEKIKTWGASPTKTAQEAAEIIQNYIDTDKLDPLNTKSLLWLFAQQLAKVGGVPKAGTIVNDGSTVPLGDSGYFLLVPKLPASGPAHDLVAAAPMFVAGGGEANPVEIREKSTIPVLTREFVEDDTVKYTTGYAKDTKDEEIECIMTATLPNNILSFESFEMHFSDFCEDQTIEITDVEEVKIVHSNNTTTDAAGYSVNKSDGEDFVHFNNLLKDNEVVPSDTIRIKYKLQIVDPEANNGIQKPNLLKASLEYSANPVEPGELTSTTTYSENDTRYTGDISRIYTFNVRVDKINQATEEHLNDIEFNVYEGDKVDNSKLLTTHVTGDDGDGEFLIMGLKEGTYCIEEAGPTEDWDAGENGRYDKAAPFTITISPRAGKNEDNEWVYTGYTSDTKLALTEGNSTAPEQARGGYYDGGNWTIIPDLTDDRETELKVTVMDSKIISLPITGEQGFWMLIIGGSLILTISLAGTAVRRRRENKETC